jgi:hypothetical protein
MTNTERTLFGMGDYGWCDYARLVASRTNVATDVIREYLQSDSFGTSFIDPNLGGHQELYHGPFHRASVLATDFELVSPQRFIDLIDEFHYDFPESVTDGQWQEVRKLVSEIRSRHTWFFGLRLTEADQDHFHSFGDILWLFREFICGSPDSDFTERLVFGYG